MADDLGFTEEQLNEALDVLVQSGLADVRTGADGEREYQLTAAGNLAADVAEQAIADLAGELWPSVTDARLADLHKRLTKLEQMLYGGTRR